MAGAGARRRARWSVLLGVDNESMCASGRRFNEDGFKDCNDTMPAVKLQLAKARGAGALARRAVCCRRSRRRARINRPTRRKAGSRWSTPAKARSAIAKGQLAVVLGIEEATLFGCKAGCLHTRHRAGGAQRLLRPRSPAHLPDPQLRQRLRWRRDLDGHHRPRQCLLDGHRFKRTTARQHRPSAAGTATASSCSRPRKPTSWPQLPGALARLLGLGPSSSDRPIRVSPPRAITKGLSGLGDFLVREMMHKGDDHRRRPHVDPRARPDARHRRGQCATPASSPATC